MTNRIKLKANEGEVEKDTPSESDIDDEAQDNDADGIEDGAVGGKYFQFLISI